MSLYSTTQSIKAQEDSCVLPAFDSNVAWEIGTTIRARCLRTHSTTPAVIYIAHTNSSQLLFLATTGPGTTPAYMHLVKRKEAVVLRWGVSTMRMWSQTAVQGKSLQEALKDRYELADPTAYSCQGGGFPVRVKNVEGPVGVIVVHGLGHDDSHGVIVDGIQQHLAAKTS